MPSPIYYFVIVSVRAYAQCASGDQWTTCRSEISLSTSQAPGIEHGLSGLGQASSLSELAHQPRCRAGWPQPGDPPASTSSAIYPNVIEMGGGCAGWFSKGIPGFWKLAVLGSEWKTHSG